MKQKLFSLVLLILAVCVGLVGCTSSDARRMENTVSLPEPAREIHAISDESGETRYVECALYYASSDDTLPSVSREIAVPYGEDIALCVLKELLSPTSDEYRSPIPNETKLLSFEHAAGIVTVNLTTDALAMQDAQDLLTAIASIGNTLLAVENVAAVNILADGMQLAIADIPVGAITKNISSIAAALAQMQSEKNRLKNGLSIERNVVVYRPDENGRWLVPHVERVAFAKDTLPHDILRCVLAEHAPSDMPELRVTSSGERILEIQLAEDSLTWQEIGAVTLTCTSFLTELSAVRIHVGDDVLENLQMGVSQLRFRNGIIRRNDFLAKIGSTCMLYCPNTSGELVRREIAVSQTAAQNAGSLLRLLFSVEPTDEILPIADGIGAEDILGLRLDDGILSVNLSENFYRACQNRQNVGERNAVYAIVNTLCELPEILGVRICIEGISAETLSGNIYLRSVLLPNVGLVSE